LRTERLIHAVVFFLLFAGLSILCGYACDVFLHGNVALLVGSIALVLGVILLVLYIVFRQFGWTWWT